MAFGNFVQPSRSGEGGSNLIGFNFLVNSIFLYSYI